jgi:hypothetical protein
MGPLYKTQLFQKKKKKKKETQEVWKYTQKLIKIEGREDRVDEIRVETKLFIIHFLLFVTFCNGS